MYCLVLWPKLKHWGASSGAPRRSALALCLSWYVGLDMWASHWCQYTSGGGGCMCQVARWLAPCRCVLQLGSCGHVGGQIRSGGHCGLGALYLAIRSSAQCPAVRAQSVHNCIRLVAPCKARMAQPVWPCAQGDQSSVRQVVQSAAASDAGGLPAVRAPYG